MSHEPPVPPGNQSIYPIKEPPHPPAPPPVPARPVAATTRGRLPIGRIVGAAAGAGALAFGIAALLFPRRR